VLTLIKSANGIYTERVNNLQTSPISAGPGPLTHGLPNNAPDLVPSLICLSDSSAVFAALLEFVRWTDEIWRPINRTRSVEDLLVISTGLCGEAGELLEEHTFMGTYKENPDELKLEFGDVLYYWARIIDHFHLDLSAVLFMEKDVSFIPPGHSRLLISVSKICETTKKFVRNDHQELMPIRQKALMNGLGMVWNDWSTMLQHHGLDLGEIIRANKEKLLKRHKPKPASPAPKSIPAKRKPQRAS
jgi:NTP pyrophosphatase (non-canonical NTP hydrolase)